MGPVMDLDEKMMISRLECLILVAKQAELLPPFANMYYENGEWGLCLSELISVFNENEFYDDRITKITDEILQYFGSDYDLMRPIKQ